MRTTLDIDDDVLEAAKGLAAKENTTAGKVLSQLARKGLSPVREPATKLKNGVPVFPERNEIITFEHVQRLIDEEGA